MKTLQDIKQDMSELYEALKSGHIETKTAAELANISGKFLKAEQLELARDIFMDNRKPKLVLTEIGVGHAAQIPTAKQ